MANITIDGKEYDLNTLSDQAKSQLIMLQAADGELRRLQQQIAIVQTARNAYAQALKAALAAQEASEEAQGGDEEDDTIKF